MTIQERRVDLGERYRRLHRREKDTLARLRAESDERADLDREAARLASDSMRAPNPERWIDRDLPDPPVGLLSRDAAPVLGDWLEERGFARPLDDADDGLWTNDDLIGTWP